jgi:hypothetical protein
MKQRQPGLDVSKATVEATRPCAKCQVVPQWECRTGVE